MNNQSIENIFGLLVTSNKLNLEELFQYVQNLLIKKETDWIQQNFVLIMRTIFNLTNCQKFYESCITIVCKNPLPVFSSKDSLSLDKKILLDLLKKDKLLLDETAVWDFLIEWGVQQTPELGKENGNREN